MATEPILVPEVGESVTEGTLSQWFKQTGDYVDEGEPLYELDTDKTSQPVEAIVAGVLTIEVEEGATVEIGTRIGSIDTEAQAQAPAASAASSSTAAAAAVRSAATAAAVRSAATSASTPVAGDSHAPASPSAQRIAAESGVDLQAVPGSGRGGRIIKEDVLAASTTAKAPAAPPPSSRPVAPTTPPPIGPASTPEPDNGQPRLTRTRMTGIRKQIAKRLVEVQQTAAILTTFNEVDMKQVMDVRSRYKEMFKEKHEVGLGFMSFFVKAVIEGLRTFPAINGRIEGEEMLTFHDHHVGVAVSTERGLMVPVIRHADRLSFAGIERAIVGFAKKAREGAISVDDLQGGTFTITNGGVFGSLLSTPILNPPQSGILGMHTIKKRPVVVDDQIVIRPMMYLALSYDHRIVDGREAVGFLVRVKECIENPERLMLEV